MKKWLGIILFVMFPMYAWAGGADSVPLAADIPFTPSGTIAATTVKTAIEELDSDWSSQSTYCSAMVCDGSTDDATALNACISTLSAAIESATGAGGTVYVPQGKVCKVSSTIVPKDYVMVDGGGSVFIWGGSAAKTGTTTINGTPADSATIVLTSESNFAQGDTIQINGETTVITTLSGTTATLYPTLLDATLANYAGDTVTNMTGAVFFENEINPTGSKDELVNAGLRNISLCGENCTGGTALGTVYRPGAFLKLHSSYGGNWSFKYGGSAPNTDLLILMADVVSPTSTAKRNVANNTFGPITSFSAGEGGTQTASAVLRRGIRTFGDIGYNSVISNNTFNHILINASEIGWEFVRRTDSNMTTGYSSVTLTSDTQAMITSAAANTWGLSGSGTGEYYLKNTSSKFMHSKTAIGRVATDDTDTAQAEETIGSLTADSWGWGDNDSLGYNTIYVRLGDDTDPDAKDTNTDFVRVEEGIGVIMNNANEYCTASTVPSSCCTGKQTGTCDNAWLDVYGNNYDLLALSNWYKDSTNIGKKGIVLNLSTGTNIQDLNDDTPWQADNNGVTTYWGIGSTDFIVDNYAISYDFNIVHGWDAAGNGLRQRLTKGSTFNNIEFLESDGAMPSNLYTTKLQAGNLSASNIITLPLTTTTIPSFNTMTDTKLCTYEAASGINCTTTGGAATVEDAAYGAGWNGDTANAPSQNAVYDEMELRATKASPTFTGTDFTYTGTNLKFHGSDGVSPILYQYSYGNYPMIRALRANGTQASKTATTTGDSLFLFSGGGYGATGYGVDKAYVAFKSIENWTDSAQGTAAYFYFTPATTATAREVLQLHPSSGIGIPDSDNTHYTWLKTGNQSATVTYTLPTAAPAGDGYALTSTTGGTMSWVVNANSGLQDTVFTDSCATGTDSVTLDFSAYNFFDITIDSGSTCTLTPSNTDTGQSFVIRIIQNSATAPVFGSTYKWPNGTAPTWSTGAGGGKIDIVSCINPVGTNMYCNGMLDVQ